jgi:hypothetical protein
MGRCFGTHLQRRCRQFVFHQHHPPMNISYKMHFPIQLLQTIANFSTMLFPNLFSRWLSATYLFSSRAADSSPKPLLRLNAQNEFHIAIFSDLHYGEEEDGWGIDQDINSTRVMNNILSFETPDFVVLSKSPSPFSSPPRI